MSAAIAASRVKFSGNLARASRWGLHDFRALGPLGGEGRIFENLGRPQKKFVRSGDTVEFMISKVGMSNLKFKSSPAFSDIP